MKKLLLLTLVLLGGFSTAFADDTWSVAGTTELTGYNFDTSENDMEYNSSTSLWEWQRSHVYLDTSAGDNAYRFKIVKNHSWDEAYPDNDWQIKGGTGKQFTETGYYNVKITFNASNHEISVTCTKMTCFTVVGDERLFGSSWNTVDFNNEMTSLGDNKWKWEKDNIDFVATYWYDFKIIKNHDYSKGQWPSSPSEHYIIKGDGTHFSKTGKYTLTIEFNESTNVIDVSVTAYNVAGDEGLIGSNWDENNTATLMTKQNDGTYKYEESSKSINANTYNYKICYKYNWYDEGGKDGGKENATITIPFSGTYDITYSFDPNISPKGVSASAVVKDVRDVTLDQSENIAQKLEIISDEEDVAVSDGLEDGITVNRTLHKGYWNTICLPVNVSNATLTEVFGSGFKLARFSSYENGEMKFENISDAENNIPYLLYVPGTQGETITSFTIKEGSLNRNDGNLSQEPVSGYKFVGNLAGQKTLHSMINTETEDALYIQGEKIKLASDKTKINSMAAFFIIPKATAAREFTFTVDGETTGIKYVVAGDKVENDNNKIFDLQGRQVENVQLGIYVVNGKKYVK